jgi:putative ABC transport system permease protein
LMLRTLFALQKVPLGISTDKVLTMDVPLSTRRYKTPMDRVLVLKRYLEAIRGTNGVVAASLNTNLHPFDNLRGEVKLAGNTSPFALQAMIHQIDQDYFRVFHIPLTSGRAWTDVEMAHSQRLVLVNRTFERLYLAGRPALGAKLQIPEMKSMFGGEPFQIIGVTGDVLNQGLSKTAAPEIYLPYTLTGTSRHLAIRTATDALRATHDITASIRRIDEEQLITNVMTMNRALEQRLLSLSHFQLVLFGLFASIGLSLAVAGIYGVISNTVESRKRELGIRLALGAQSGQVIGLVLNSGLRMVLLGIGIGVAGALLLTRFMANFLFGIHAADPLSFAAVMLVLGTAGVAACLEPAIRAARIDPVCSLRQE